MLKIFATFLKKGSAKNFPTGKVLGYFSKIVRSTFISSTPSFCRRKVGFNERLPPRGSCRTNVRLKEYACSIKFNNSMPRKLLPPLTRSPSLEREAWVTLRRKHLIRHLSVTPSPTGEGNRKALFRQQILVRLLTEEWVKLAFSCERRGTAIAVDE